MQNTVTAAARVRYRRLKNCSNRNEGKVKY